MSNISAVSSQGYEVRQDTMRPGGYSLTKTDARAANDTVSISQAGRELATQIAAMRDEASGQTDAATRYQTALEFGQDFASYMDNNINLLNEAGRKYTSDDLRHATNRQSSAFTTVSAQGTVVGISYTVVEGGGYFQQKPEIYTAQITRKDGLQINLALDDDVRINDLEDGGLSIYYASSGTTRTFDAEGKESITYGEPDALGTDGDDIIINRSSMRVDAGAGNDTIINLADGAELLGGDGDDQIFLTAVESKDVTIDGGAGNDRIMGQSLSNATIHLEDGNDSLTATLVQGASITSSGDDALKIDKLVDSLLTSRRGALSTDIGALLESTVDIERVQNSFATDSIRGSSLRFGDGDISISANSISESDVKLENGDLSINANLIHGSTITHNNGNNKITGNIMNSTLDLKIGNNDLNLKGISNSLLNLGDGINNIISGGIGKSTLNMGSGNNNITTGFIEESTLNMSNGENIIKATGINYSLLNVDSADNDIYLDFVTNSTIYTSGGNNTINTGNILNSSLNFANGNNSLESGIILDANIHMKNGRNTITSDGGITNSTVDLGGGENSINTSGIRDSKINMKSGGNSIHSAHISQSEISFSEVIDDDSSGNKPQNINEKINTISSVFIDESTVKSESSDLKISAQWSVDSIINTGQGNAKIEIDSSMNSVIKTGNGDADIGIRSFYQSKLRTGGGDDNILINNAYSSHIDAGEGDNTLWIGTATDSTLPVGNGKKEFLTDAAGSLAKSHGSATTAKLDAMLMETLFDQIDTPHFANDRTKADTAHTVSEDRTEDSFPIWPQVTPSGSQLWGNAPTNERMAEFSIPFVNQMSAHLIAHAAAAYSRHA